MGGINCVVVFRLVGKNVGGGIDPFYCCQANMFPIEQDLQPSSQLFVCVCEVFQSCEC